MFNTLLYDLNLLQSTCVCNPPPPPSPPLNTCRVPLSTLRAVVKYNPIVDENQLIHCLFINVTYGDVVTLELYNIRIVLRVHFVPLNTNQ